DREAHGNHDARALEYLGIADLLVEPDEPPHARRSVRREERAPRERAEQEHDGHERAEGEIAGSRSQFFRERPFLAHSRHGPDREERERQGGHDKAPRRARQVFARGNAHGDRRERENQSSDQHERTPRAIDRARTWSRMRSASSILLITG